MIKINLVKRRKPGAGGGKPLELFGFQLGKGLDVAILKDYNWKGSPIPRILASLVVVYFAQIQSDKIKEEKLEEEEAKITVVQAEQDGFAKKMAKVKGFEPLKKQLEDDEKNIQTKLNIINSLLENRDAPSRVLKQLSQIIPAEVWINNLSVKDGKLNISGGSTSYNLVSDFMKGIGDSSLFSGVNLSQVNETEKDGIKYQQFDISANTRGY